MTEKRQFPPIFATNRPDQGEPVAAELIHLLKGVRENYASPAMVNIATAYLNPGGFVLLADE